MKYLCDSHRDEFANNPQQAAQAWRGIIVQARELFHMQAWEKASVVYGNAFEIAELLLSSNPSQYSVDRYLRSALEYAYSLRKHDAKMNLGSLIVHVKNHIRGIQHTMAVPLLLEPLEEVIKLPLNLADYWMQSLLSLDTIESRVLH
jgi:hypothetical protein